MMSTTSDYQITLPWPPSHNTLYRNVNGMTIMSRAGREYNERIANVIYSHDDPAELFDGAYGCRLTCHPDTRRKRDLDNVPKTILDALTKCGVWVDDSMKHLRDLRLVVGELRKPAEVVVEIFHIAKTSPWEVK